MARTTDLPALLDGFRLSCLAEGKRLTTIRWYMGKLKIFLRYLQTQELPTDAAELTTTHLRTFLVHLRENVRPVLAPPVPNQTGLGMIGQGIKGARPSSASTTRPFH